MRSRRGAPGTGRYFSAGAGGGDALPWHEVLALLMRYSEYEIAGDKGLYYSNRIKQWFSYLKLQYPQAEQLFAKLRLLRRSPEILALLQSELAQS